MAALLRLTSRIVRPLNKIPRLSSQAAFISTSPKNKDVITTLDPMSRDKHELKDLEKHFENLDSSEDKNWIHYGYDTVDKDKDRFIHNITMFVTVTMCLVGGSYLATYLPDRRLVEWSVREAYLELERRERDGLDLISPDLLPPDSIELPPDDEITEEIII
ncbi:NADH dehydrogenase [ubiquinone] 1 beta subcomplex subunit 11, mitochondrial-like [Argonauta hians]